MKLSAWSTVSLSEMNHIHCILGRCTNLSVVLQVVAVLAHELGHWKLGHTKFLMAIQQVVMLSQFMLFAVVRSSPHLLAAFGFEGRRPVIVSLLLFSMVSEPIDKLIGYLFNLLSRRYDSTSWCMMVCVLYCVCNTNLHLSVMRDRQPDWSHQHLGVRGFHATPRLRAAYD